METEYHKLKAAPSFKHIFDTTTTTTTTTISREGSESELPRYTSLKDIMMNSSPKDAANNNEPGNIAIRNELVKHAASAYVLSATINPKNRDQDWNIPGTWERIKTSCVGFQSCWQIHVGLPVEDLCRPFLELFYQVVHRVRNGLRGKVEIN